MSGHVHAEHAPHLAHHFDTPKQQFESGKLGMWLFLATELLMFGGLFCAYAVYRAGHPEVFLYAHRFLDVTLGGINTVVLICSSLTMAWAVRAAQLGQRGLLVLMLLLTLAGAFGFLGIKYVEYSHKFHEGLLWGTRYGEVSHPADHGAAAMDAGHGAAADAGHAPAGSAPAAAPVPGTWDAPTSEHSFIPPAASAPTGLAPAPAPDAGHGAAADAHAPAGPEPDNVHLFFGIYFVMTGLHGIHVLAGIAVITWLLIGAIRGKYGPDYFIPVDNVGLYWHVVDLIWIFLFPLLYLIH